MSRALAAVDTNGSMLSLPRRHAATRPRAASTFVATSAARGGIAVDGIERIEILVALERRAVPDPARVPRHKVERAEDLAREHGPGVAEEVDARPARTAGIGEEHAHALDRTRAGAPGRA